jgi:mannuronan synthase
MNVIPLVHEAQTQRQHVRVKAPARASLWGREYPVVDWAVGGFAVSDIAPQRALGDRVTAEFVFAYDGFRFQVDLPAIVRNVSPNGQRTGFQFVDLTEERLSLLQFMIGAYLSGEVVSSADLLAILQRDNMGKPRADRTVDSIKGASLLAASRKLAVLGVLWVAIGALFFVIVSSMASRLFLAKGLATIVSSETSVVATPQSGIVRTLAVVGTHVAPGAPLASLELSTGRERQIVSPCDCVVVAGAFQEGQFAPASAALATLAPAGGALVVGQAFITIEDTAKIRVDDRVAIFLLSDRRTIYGRVSHVVVPSFGNLSSFGATGDRLYSIVTIRLDEPATSKALGEAATAQIDTLHLPHLFDGLSR